MIIRPYDQNKDKEALMRIWQESGWMNKKPDKKFKKALKSFMECGSAKVGLLHNEAECFSITHQGTMMMLDAELSFQAVSGIAVSHTARRMGGATELTALAVLDAALNGVAVTALGIFDQGFYDKLGFGAFPYIHFVMLDPLQLDVPRLKRQPIRLSTSDMGRVTANIATQHSHHGLVKIPLDGFFAMIVAEAETTFGLGFENSQGRLTHHVWLQNNGEENGPYEVIWMTYEDYSGMMEILSLLKSFGDQVNSIFLQEPWGIQLQDLIKRPFRTKEISKGSKFSNGITAAAYQQARIVDLNQTLMPLKLPKGRLRFNLEMIDPIIKHLNKDSEWTGIGGAWTISLGEEGSSSVAGYEAGLPLMKASVNAFTRLVFGVAPASALAVADNLDAPSNLLEDLDIMLRLPVPGMVQVF